MNKFLKNLVILISLLVFFSCKSTQQKKEHVSRQPQKASSLKIGAHDIPPGQCRIIGTIISIAEVQQTGNADSPCTQAPCQAIVRVDSVLGYGQGFISPLSKSKEVQITFKFTLSPTKNLFKNMTKMYPGLEVGSKFRATVEAQQLLGTKSFKYSISGYEVIKTKSK